jgi:hypothetical protein
LNRTGFCRVLHILFAAQMLVLHSGAPFSPITGKHGMFSEAASESAAASDQQHSGQSRSGASSRESQKPASADSSGSGCNSPDSSDKHWRHNKYAGGMFSKHLRQVY